MGYQTQSLDTNIEADRLLFSRLRQHSDRDRLCRAMAQNTQTQRLFWLGLKRRFRPLTPAIAAQAFYKDDYPDGFQPGGNEMTWSPDPISLTLLLHPHFEALELAYYVSGGVAAIFYGEYRTTQDADVILNLTKAEIPALADRLTELGFYVAGVDDVISDRLTSFQAIHTETLAKADLIVADASEFELAKFARRRLEVIDGAQSMYLISPEDLVLSKLAWRQRSRSDKQWRDVLGILKIQAETLDRDYLDQWAGVLHVTAELQAALSAAGLA